MYQYQETARSTNIRIDHFEAELGQQTIVGPQMNSGIDFHGFQMMEACSKALSLLYRNSIDIICCAK